MSNERSPARVLLHDHRNEWHVVGLLSRNRLVARKMLQYEQPVSCRRLPVPVVNREVVPSRPARARMGADHRAVRARGLARRRGRVRGRGGRAAARRLGVRRAAEGVVEEVADGERIVFRWGDSRVEWILEDHPAGNALPGHRASLRRRHEFTWGPRLLALSNASLLCPA